MSFIKYKLSVSYRFLFSIPVAIVVLLNAILALVLIQRLVGKKSAYFVHVNVLKWKFHATNIVPALTF